MPSQENFHGCKVFFYQGANRIRIAESTVLDFEHDSLSLTVSDRLEFLTPNTQVTLLILRDGRAHEFCGVMRRVLGRAREVTLYQGREKESRQAARYEVDLPARVSGVFLVQSRILPLATPLDARVINLSEKGVLLRTRAILNHGTRFQMLVNTGAGEMKINACVKRVRTLTEGEAEYGCEFMAENSP